MSNARLVFGPNPFDLTETTGLSFDVARTF